MITSPIEGSNPHFGTIHICSIRYFLKANTRPHAKTVTLWHAFLYSVSVKEFLPNQSFFFSLPPDLQCDAYAEPATPWSQLTAVLSWREISKSSLINVMFPHHLCVGQHMRLARAGPAARVDPLSETRDGENDFKIVLTHLHLWK
ncbi:hypothetical protein CEXT_717421 [Caerostris extrusa]|uniref:Uncharacterized protein n=1 Tax=Caerostris extrusa TaxID=172846 RepID=A0AAV4RPD6_CAEEX|nr:hypothetical protein CEXT_717421 [Caerostris extrusa]